MTVAPRSGLWPQALLLITAWALAPATRAAESVLPNDPMEPIASAEGALLVTRDLAVLVILGRSNGLNQAGATEPGSGLGGPSYSSLIVENAAAMETFFTEVLDLERRTGREWSIFQPRFPYITLHGRGARFGAVRMTTLPAPNGLLIEIYQR